MELYVLEGCPSLCTAQRELQKCKAFLKCLFAPEKMSDIFGTLIRSNRNNAIFSSVHTLFIKNSVDNLIRKWYNVKKCRMRNCAKQNSTDM